MRCRAARRSFLESTLHAEPDPCVASTLEEHLNACASCAEEAREGRHLIAGLERLRVEIPFPLDVTGPVMAKLPQFDDIERAEIPRVWIGSIAVAALSAAVVTAWILIGQAPSLGLEPGRLWVAAGGITTALVELVRPLRHFAGALWTLGFHAWAVFSPLLSRIARLAPSYQSAALTAAVAIISATALVVRRDLRRLATNPTEKET